MPKAARLPAFREGHGEGKNRCQKLNRSTRANVRNRSMTVRSASLSLAAGVARASLNAERTARTEVINNQMKMNSPVPECFSANPVVHPDRWRLMKTKFIPLGSITTLVVVLAGGVVTDSIGAPAQNPRVDRELLQAIPIEAPVPQHAVTGVVIFSPGSAERHHLHHGIESGYVLSGEVEVVSDGEPSRIYRSGEKFIIYRDHPHISRNPGTTEASVLGIWIIDADKPLTTLVP
jgi:quercetin dioxygenase-like cupin family protein